jgi:hypothetical protein
MQKAERRRRSQRSRKAGGKANLTTIGARLFPQGVPDAYGKSGRRQYPRAEDFVFAERFKRGIGDRADGQCVSQRVEHLGTGQFLAGIPMSTSQTSPWRGVICCRADPELPVPLDGARQPLSSSGRARMFPAARTPSAARKACQNGTTGVPSWHSERKSPGHSTRTRQFASGSLAYPRRTTGDPLAIPYRVPNGSLSNTYPTPSEHAANA